MREILIFFFNNARSINFGRIKVTVLKQNAIYICYTTSYTKARVNMNRSEI